MSMTTGSCFKLVILYEQQLIFVDVLEEVRGRLFPDGEPVCSAQAVCNLSFTYAGELMAMAIVHGGPAPSLLKRWVYDYLASGVNSVNPSVEDLNSSQLKSFISQVMHNLDHVL